MPVVIQNGGGGDVTSSELGGYVGGHLSDYDTQTQTFIDLPRGDLTPEQAQLVSAVEQKVDAIVEGWIDSGGPGGYQRLVGREILRRAALLQGDLSLAVKHWSKPGRERAWLEILGTLTRTLTERDRLLLELRERLNASPYVLLIAWLASGSAHIVFEALAY